MKAISSDVQVTQIRPASRCGSRSGIPSCGVDSASSDSELTRCDGSMSYLEYLRVVSYSFSELVSGRRR